MREGSNPSLKSKSSKLRELNSKQQKQDCKNETHYLLESRLLSGNYEAFPAVEDSSDSEEQVDLVCVPLKSSFHRQAVDFRKVRARSFVEMDSTNSAVAQSTHSSKSKNSNIGSTRTAVTPAMNPALGKKHKVLIGVIAREIMQEMFLESTKQEFITQKSSELSSYLEILVNGLNDWFSGSRYIEDIGIHGLLLSTLYIRQMKLVEPSSVLNVHLVDKLFAVMMLIATKSSEEAYISNQYWAEVSSIPMQELKTLETTFCSTIGSDFRISEVQIKKVYAKNGLIDQYETRQTSTRGIYLRVVEELESSSESLV